MKTLSLKLSILAIILLGTSSLQSNTIKEVVEHTMTNNPKIMATLKNNDAYRLYIDEAKAGFYPKLDLTTYIGHKTTIIDPDIGNDTSNSTEGFNAQLDFEQLLFDGGLSSSQVDEAQSRYMSNKHLNDSIVDDIIFDSLDSYLNLVKYKNRLAVGEQSIIIYNDYYVLAKETEEISGESLHKSQVNAKIHYANNKIYQDTNNHLRAVSSFKKNVGVDPDGKSCRPNLDSEIVPSTLKVLIDDVLVKNPLILEQVENIKEQRAILNQRDSKFYPTIKFKAQGIYDEDLITEYEKTKIHSVGIELTYNFFNGNKDKKVSIREKIFLEESQRKLDTVTIEVIDETTAAFNSYNLAAKREIELLKYIEDNKEILRFYKDQFEGGTRTFIDVLNIERDLVSAKEDLIDIQYEMDSAYFQIFKSLGNLKQSVLSSNNDICTETKIETEDKVSMQEESTSEELQAILEEESSTSVEEMKVGTYAVYFVAYKELAKIEQAIKNMRERVGDSYQLKYEEVRGLKSAVIYNLETMEVAKELRSKVREIYSDAYIRKIK